MSGKRVLICTKLGEATRDQKWRQLSRFLLSFFLSGGVCLCENEALVSPDRAERSIRSGHFSVVLVERHLLELQAILQVTTQL